VYFAGERAAGLHAQQFNVELWLDPTCLDKKEDIIEWLEETKRAIIEVYVKQTGGDYPTWVLYDFESDG